MIALPTMLAAGVLASCVATTISARNRESSPQHTHTCTSFQFTVNAPPEQVAPLFGANEERKWAHGWNPIFLYPTPAHDQQGMVFQVAHGHYVSTWVNTTFDLSAGHIQYAYVLNDLMTTSIDIRLAPKGAGNTEVTVVYERTALVPEANEHVQQFASGDVKARSEWQEQINSYLATQAHKRR